MLMAAAARNKRARVMRAGQCGATLAGPKLDRAHLALCLLSPARSPTLPSIRWPMIVGHPLLSCYSVASTKSELRAAPLGAQTRNKAAPTLPGRLSLARSFFPSFPSSGRPRTSCATLLARTLTRAARPHFLVAPRAQRHARQPPVSGRRPRGRCATRARVH